MKSVIIVALMLTSVSGLAGTLKCKAGKYGIELSQVGQANQIEYKFFDENGKLAIRSQITRIASVGNKTSYFHNPTNHEITVFNLQSKETKLYGILDIHDPDAGPIHSKIKMFCAR
ncbi:MAG: hypothetical protein AABY64_13750 [Bdellovibrionota bacterium]